jgi:hypothetical protein
MRQFLKSGLPRFAGKHPSKKVPRFSGNFLRRGQAISGPFGKRLTDVENLIYKMNLNRSVSCLFGV